MPYFEDNSLPPITQPTVLFLDFDGTLVELAATPNLVHVPAAVIVSLPALKRKLQGALALGSGSSLDSLYAFMYSLRKRHRPVRMVWCCMPRFDGDPIFNALLDASNKDSEFAIDIEHFSRTQHWYETNSAVLCTQFYSHSGQAVGFNDFVPRLLEL